DWRVVVLCPLGTRVLSPWAIAVAEALRARYVDVDLHYTDDGMAFRIPACEEAPPADLFLPRAEGVEGIVTRALHGTALFAARFRECAARALLLPRRDPRRRTPLWAQRKRASDLLAVASRHPAFPIVLETYRECLRDAFDMPGLVALLRDVEGGRVRVLTADTRRPSPFAASVLFFFVANFIYDTDAPPAERRALSLSVDFERLAELLGEAELRGLLDPEVIDDHVRGLQRLSRPATSLDAVHDMLLAIGDLSPAELRSRTSPEAEAPRWARALVESGRAIRLRVGGELRLVAVEDAARLRDALGLTLPEGLPPSLASASTSPEDARREIVARYARTHGPFLEADVAARFGLAEGAVTTALSRLLREGRLVHGAFLPSGAEREYCSRDVLEALRRRSLARLRRTIEPVPPAALSRLVLDWQGLNRRRRGRDALLAVVGELEGCPLVASALEGEIMPARIEGYRPWDLDALCASGEVVWAGLEPLGASDGRVALYLAEHEAALSRAVVPVEGAAAAAVRDLLGRRGAVFFPEILRALGGFPGAVLETLWQMVWAGEVTNDTLEPLRSRARAASTPESRRRPERRGRPGRGAAVSPLRVRALRGGLPAAARGSPPGSEGRWSLRSARWAAPPTETDRRAALARALLERYGVVTREAAHVEGVPGGFAAVYDVLKALEEQGRVRRGHFVEGRGGAQFALPGADERLRALREATGDRPPAPGAEPPRPLVVAATDPANAWGALLDWPAAGHAEARPQRAADARVVLREGVLLGWMGRGDHPVLTFLPEQEPARSNAARALAGALASLVDEGGRAALLISTIDGVDATASPLAGAFAAAGFTRAARGLMKRRQPAGADARKASTT
ncbi:MAG: winged helix DNA-binding domain-containing protein, partial [Myxococcales bacterium]|nr:winged helix DNA-binding domain-containing protein [Myxococcales bacterium]